MASDSLINVIYTLQHQALDFLNTSKLEQLFDREKLMMSCPEPSAGSPTPRAPSLNNRMSTTAGPVFGEGTCQSRPQPAGDQVHRPIRGGPCTAGSGPGSETPSGVTRSCEWATETTCRRGCDRGIWNRAAVPTKSVVGCRRPMELVTDVSTCFFPERC